MIYLPDDLTKFALTLRDGAARSFSETYTENLDDFISINQTINLIKTYSETDKKNRYRITDDMMSDLFNDIRDWIYGVGLAKLCAKGVVDCAWDSEHNNMVFWLNNDEKTSINSQSTKYE